MDNIFKARYKNNKGQILSINFDKSTFTQDTAKAVIDANGIKNFWFVMEPQKPEIINDNTVLFNGEVGFEITKETLLPHLKNGKEILINSYGGYLNEGWELHDLIKNYYPETKIGVLGSAFSSAMQILLAAKLENRTATENSQGLIHNPWVEVAGDDLILKTVATQLEKDKIKLSQLYADVSGKEQTEILEIMKQEKTLTANEMLQYNFISSIKQPIQNKEVKEDLKEEPQIINNNTDSDMNEKQTEAVNLLTKSLEAFKNLFSPAKDVKNLIMADTSGIELDFDVESENEIGEGTNVQMDGKPANGTFDFPNFVITAENGIVTNKEEKEEINEEVEALKAEIETLKAEAAEAVNKSNEQEQAFNFLKEEKETIFNSYNEIEKQFQELKNTFSKKPEIENKVEVADPKEDKKPSFKIK